MSERYVLKHAYIRVGEPLPVSVQAAVHIAERKNDIGLDIWWISYEDVE